MIDELKQRIEDIEQENRRLKAEKERLKIQFDISKGINQTVPIEN